jgi:hypothetical protein
MYSSSDFEKVWFLYKTEGEPKGISINAFCENQGVPYEQSTFMETSKAMKINFRDYFVKVIIEMNQGRSDYKNLLPMIISLK